MQNLDNNHLYNQVFPQEFYLAQQNNESSLKVIKELPCLSSVNNHNQNSSYKNIFLDFSVNNFSELNSFGNGLEKNLEILEKHIQDFRDNSNFRLSNLPREVPQARLLLNIREGHITAMLRYMDAKYCHEYDNIKQYIKPDTIYINLVYTTPNYKKQSCMTSLFQNLFDKNHDKKFVLWAKNNNFAAISLYKKLNFSEEHSLSQDDTLFIRN